MDPKDGDESMYGVWVNALAVVVGGLIGSLLKGGIPARIKETLNYAIALCVLVIGVSGAIATSNMMGTILSIVLGAVLGETIRIEDGLDRLGQCAQRKFARGDDGFSQGFINATLLFCVGAMAVVGSMEAGLSDKADTLLAKSALDGVSAMIFASTLGPGVILSAVPLLVYQGGIALAFRLFGGALSGAAGSEMFTLLVGEMSAVGSVLIIGLSINMLGILKERIKVGNLLPAMLIPLLYYPLTAWISGLNVG